MSGRVDEICHCREEGDGLPWPVTFKAWRKSEPHLIGQGPTLALAIEDLTGEAFELICEGCGTSKSIEEIQMTHPTAVSCCPERKMIMRQS